jgi:hypothetical protein
MNVYSSPSKIRLIKEDEMGMVGSTHRAKRNAYRKLVGKIRKETIRKTEK